MKKIIYFAIALVGITATFSCNDEETYAEMKKKEKHAIENFIKDNDYTGPITVITEKQFAEQDSTTDTTRNEFVLFEDDGIYMQVISRGEGKSMIEMSKEQPDSTVSKNILCRFLEYDIESAEVTATNKYSSSIVDKMLCKYKHRGRSYTASFTSGMMLSTYSSATVPSGWLKPLDYIRLTKNAGRIAKVRLIVPHSSGTSNAQGYVLPMYYEISYQLAINE
jgi:hypothetical protein